MIHCQHEKENIFDPVTLLDENLAKMKSLMITTGSILLTAGVLANAYYQKKQFYPSVVYITKSSPSMAVRHVICQRLGHQ
jgi:hypothetical protein